MPSGQYIRKSKSIFDRFWSKVDENGPVPESRPDLGPCWLWTGTRNGPAGYGLIHPIGHNQVELSHRFSYELQGNPIPDDLELDHLCRNRICCNPKHLEAVPHQTNISRGLGGSHNRIKTHCPQGHEYTPSNAIRRYGARYCRECHRIRSRKDWRKQTAAIRLSSAVQIPIDLRLPCPENMDKQDSDSDIKRTAE